MKRFKIPGITLLIFCSISASSQNLPNIVFILADDFGYGSVNCYGADESLVRTPHINHIAEQGMRFTNAYTPASICSPTRYGFLTGRYPWRSALKFGVMNVCDTLLIDPDRITIADYLKQQGYNTAAIGKWHLGYGNVQDHDYTGTLSPGPLDLGFDYHFAVPQNHDDMTGVYIENDQVYGLRSKELHPYSKSFYGKQYMGLDAPQRVNVDVMDDLTGKTVEWIRKQNEQTPFFIYFGAVAVHHPITPSEYMRGMSGCGPYGDFIQDMDRCVGKIIEALSYKGFLGNTIIIFTSDNGGDIPYNDPLRPETSAMNAGLKSNGILRGDKHTIYEGGSRVPFIVSWPGVIEENSYSDDLISLLDVFATLGDIIMKPLPEKNKEIAPDSYSFYPSLTQTKGKGKRGSLVYADANGMHAIRSGDWKYIDDTPPDNLPGERKARLQKDFKTQLYNLNSDPSEEKNLIDENPDKFISLSKQLDKIRMSPSSR